MLDTLILLKEETFLIEILCIVFILFMFISYYFPNVTPLWVNGLFRPNRRQLINSNIKFHLVHGDKSKYSIFKFKHNMEYLELDKRLHCWLLDTRYRNLHKKTFFGVPYILQIISVYRKIMVSNIEDMVTNNIELNSLEVLEAASGKNKLDPRLVRFEFRIIPFYYSALYDDSIIKLIMVSIKRWTNSAKEWHNLRLAQEIIDGLGVLEVRYKDELILSEYGLINLVGYEGGEKIEVAPDV